MAKERIIGVSDTPLFTEPPKPLNWQQITERQKEFYAERVGKVYGDFEVINVEYDVYRRLQKWTLKCTKCGDEKITYNGKDYVKGRSRHCHCYYDAIREQKELEKEKLRQERNPITNYSDPSWIGAEKNGYKVIKLIDGGKNKKFQVRCSVCGRERTMECRSFNKGDFGACKHEDKENYSDPKYIGQKYGNLTVLKYENAMFFVRCDCGNEKWCRPVDIVKREHSVKTCGSPNCSFHRKALKDANLHNKYFRADGINFENEYEEYLVRKGYDVERTKGAGDFGVDLIVHEDDGDVAIQLKKHKQSVGVSAVQAVYSGGKFYGCDRFEVVCTNGFTTQAREMADKLGVKLVDMDRSICRFQINDRNVYWTINGVKKKASEWCDEYGVSHSSVNYRVKKGMTVEEALLKPTRKRGKIEIDGEEKTKQEWCRQYGVSPAMFDYRTKTIGMTPYEALTTPKITAGRPRKA